MRRLIYLGDMGIALLAATVALGAEFTGMVVDPAGAPINSATVELRREGSPAVISALITDRSGRFRLTTSDSGTYQLSFHAPYFRRFTLTRTISEDDRISLSGIELKLAIDGCEARWERPTIRQKAIEAGTELSGRAAFRGGTALHNASAIIESDSKTYGAAIDEGGSFHFSGIDPGLYTLRIVQDGVSEFVLEGVEVGNKRRTEILETMELTWCLSGVECKVNKVLKDPFCL